MHSARIVELFAGPGGLAESARQLGHHSIGIEHCPDACSTRAAAGHVTIRGDVRDHAPHMFPSCTALLGGPPCQTFSAAGTGAGRAQLDLVLDLAKRRAARENITADLAGLTDPRTALVLEPLRWALEAADEHRPYEAIVLEQVPQALPVWEAYAEILRAEGYGFATGVLRAEEYGAPQTRRRYVKGVPQHAGDPTLLPWASMGDVLPHRGEFTVVSNYGTGGDPKNRGRRTSAEPAFTVTGKVSRTRLVDNDGAELPRLTWAEAGALQGFPADYPWTGGDIGQQIGNAVPVPLGRAILAAALA
ncbi:MAG: DNA cytosine methyltransferase [Streptomyces sp.]|nr:DNA cytosine methyltransferase [Streptomyces sp.]